MRVLSMRAAAARAAFLFATGAGALSGQETTFRQGPPVVVTSGTGEVRIAPDKATLTLGVQTRAGTAAAASAENARKQTRVISAIKAQGIGADQITTSGYAVQPELQYDPAGKGPPRILGYTVSNSVTVESRKVDGVASLLDAALGAGANTVDGVVFSIVNADSARRMALSMAVTRARGDAEVAARAAGGTLGQLLELHVSDFPMPSPRPMYRASAAMELAASATPIEAGTSAISAGVTVRWQFVPGPR